MDIKKIKSEILELCSEDAYGSWELWWNGSFGIPSSKIDDFRKDFIDIVESLVKEEKLIPFHHKDIGGSYIKVPFERLRLEFETEHSSPPDPDTYYWFEATEDGKKEDMALRS